MTAVQRHHSRNRHAAFHERADHGRRALTEAALELRETGKAELRRGLAKASIANTYVTLPASALSLVGVVEFEHVAVRALNARSVPVRSGHARRSTHGVSRGECESRNTLDAERSRLTRKFCRLTEVVRPSLFACNGGVA